MPQQPQLKRYYAKQLEDFNLYRSVHRCSLSLGRGWYKVDSIFTVMTPQDLSSINHTLPCSIPTLRYCPFRTVTTKCQTAAGADYATILFIMLTIWSQFFHSSIRVDNIIWVVRYLCRRSCRRRSCRRCCTFAHAARHHSWAAQMKDGA